MFTFSSIENLTHLPPPQHYFFYFFSESLPKNRDIASYFLVSLGSWHARNTDITFCVWFQRLGCWRMSFFLLSFFSTERRMDKCAEREGGRPEPLRVWEAFSTLQNPLASSGISEASVKPSGTLLSATFFSLCLPQAKMETWFKVFITSSGSLALAW